MLGMPPIPPSDPLLYAFFSCTSNTCAAPDFCMHRGASSPVAPLEDLKHVKPQNCCQLTCHPSRGRIAEHVGNPMPSVLQDRQAAVRYCNLLDGVFSAMWMVIVPAVMTQTSTLGLTDMNIGFTRYCINVKAASYVGSQPSSHS
ncbi:unnamed protein product [Cyclocybe aegerita]|uniref:Uncharacterized protein n=1 Tax=Cyclocybe aegerita TaxID=1973307 RepID=A0A8S0W9N5_CYCAE|nr:unnamed protein product [Cyclocybe aegerita]